MFILGSNFRFGFFVILNAVKVSQKKPKRKLLPSVFYSKNLKTLPHFLLVNIFSHICTRKSQTENLQLATNN